MILVATGTTGFDALTRTMDRLAGALDQPVVIQIGNGRLIPSHAQHFRFATSLQPYYQRASLVVSHGGMGTCLEVLAAGKPLIAVDNPDRYDQHQADLLGALETEGFLLWCRQVTQLEAAIARARQTSFRPYQSPDSTVHLRVRELLGTLPHGSRRNLSHWPPDSRSQDTHR